MAQYIYRASIVGFLSTISVAVGVPFPIILLYLLAGIIAACVDKNK